MKSTTQKQYEKLIIHYLSNLDVCAAHRSSLFLDFFRNSETYYDDLCAFVYELSAGNLTGPLWMSKSGYIYTGKEPQNIDDNFLSDCAEMPVFDGDILDQLDYVFSKIYSISLTNSSSKTHSCQCNDL